MISSDIIDYRSSLEVDTLVTFELRNVSVPSQIRVYIPLPPRLNSVLLFRLYSSQHNSHSHSPPTTNPTHKQPYTMSSQGETYKPSEVSFALHDSSRLYLD